MPQFMLRYDLRQAAFCSASSAEMYQAAIDQCAWDEKNGFVAVHLSEHHSSSDGYCPTPYSHGWQQPGPMSASSTAVVFMADERDAYWEQIAPHLLHETNMYADWAERAQLASPYKRCENLLDLRSGDSYQVLTPTEMLAKLDTLNSDALVLFHPLCGGIHPDLAWQSPKLFAAKVLPELA